MALTPDQIREAMAMPDLPWERVGEIMRQVGHRARVIEDLKGLGARPRIPRDGRKL